ncbi:hypothetical protein LWI29_017035 [Acer saccharum]|uniref:Malectin-like domain-containing protein n=1 Tax=Acer saccharum TaxID=4024 RepID=A0AA39SU85_ACESA|nr:hypothetical protein LWI29_017035 [Acer saccharum]
MEESSDPISGDWLNKILGLNSKSAASLDSVHEVSSGASEEGEWGLVERCQSQPDRLEVRKEVFGGVSEKEAKMGVGSGMNRSVRVPIPRTQNLKSKALGITCRASEKGKARWIQKPKSKIIRFPFCKKGIRIGGDKSVRASFNGSFESSSSDEESEGRCLMRSGVGECSKAKIIEPCNDKVIRPSEDGPGGLGKQQVMVQQSGNSSSPVKDCSGALANLGEGGSSPKAHSTPGLIEEGFVSPITDCITGNLMLATERCKGQGIDLCIDLRDQDSGSSDDIAHSREQSSSQDTVVDETQFDENGKVLRTVTKKQQRKGIESSIKTHPMLTRRANANSSLENKKFMWNLEVEIAKLIEKRMAIWVSEGRGSKSEDENDFISIDCGLPENSGYTDKKTGINYTSDATFTETGVSYNISSEYNSNTLEQQFLNVRSFPEGTRNCYTIKHALANIKFLIRARFMYGNYDGKSKVPSFDLLLGADVWDSVELENASTIVTKEIIHIPRLNYVYVCLINKGSGTPFISSLEFRVLKNNTYETQSGSLLLHLRWDLGSTTNKTIRYGDDIYDRIWEPYNRPNWATISTSSSVYTGMDYQQPSTVMSTAVTPLNGNDSLTFSWATGDNTTQYFVYLHFAELQQAQMTKQTRQMYIYLSGTLWYTKPYVLKYLETSILYSTSPTNYVEISINKTEESPLPPILNALEIYKVKDFQQLLTNQQDDATPLNEPTHLLPHCRPKIGTRQQLKSSVTPHMALIMQFLNYPCPQTTGGNAQQISLEDEPILNHKIKSLMRLNFLKNVGKEAIL